MANKDAENAYALFSPRAQRQIPISKIQELLDGKNYFLFEGYQSLSVSNPNISAAFSSIFLASGFSYSPTLSMPAHTHVTQAVR